MLLVYAGKDCSNYSVSVHTLTAGFVNVVCRSPDVFEPGCMPVTGTRQTPNFQAISGWTEDGMVLQKIRTAMNMVEDPWPFVAPCGIQDMWGTASAVTGLMINGSLQQPLPPYPVGYVCEEVTVGTFNASRITELNFNTLLDTGYMAPDKLRLVPEIFQLPYLRVLTSTGYSMNGSKCP